MVPERKRDGNLTKDRETHGESNVLSIAHGNKKILGLDVDFG